MRSLAIDIGGTKLQMAIFDTLRETVMIEKRRIPTSREGGGAWMVKTILDQARQLHSEFGFQRVGIGFGGPVDFQRQQLVQSTHVDGWSGIDLVASLKQFDGKSAIQHVAIDNDANVGGLGEASFGAGQGCDPLLYVTLSTGVGGGIIYGGNRVLRGADSYAGELGHLTIQPNGPECLCGSNGCLERLCGGLWIERDFGRPMVEMIEDQEFVSRYVVHLAQGLKAAIMMLNPARIVIGGGIPKAGEKLFAPLRKELSRQMPTWSRARVDVVAAALGDDSVLFGCLPLLQATLSEKTKEESK
jgi:glucokinase